MRPSSGVRRLDSKHNVNNGSNSQNSKSTTDNTNERQGSQLELQDSDEDEIQ